MSSATVAPNTAKAAQPAQGPTVEIDIDKIHIDKAWNSRQHFEPTGPEEMQLTEEATIAALAENIKAHGLINPPTVRPRADGKYDLVVGFRRMSALKKLGWKTVFCEVFNGDEVAAILRNLSENVQRRDLTTYDLAVKCKLLKDRHHLSGSDVAKVLQKDRTYINILVQRLEALPDYIVRAWADPASPRHGLCDTATLNKLVKLAKDPDALRAQWDILCGVSPSTNGSKGSGSGSTEETETAAPPVRRPTSVRIAEAIKALEETRAVKKEHAAMVIAALKWAGAIGGNRAPKTLRLNGTVIYDPTRKPEKDEEEDGDA